MIVVDTTDLLRGRFSRLRQGRPLYKLYQEVGVHFSTLSLFLRGAPVAPRTLEKIEAWCVTQEGQRCANPA